MRTSPAPGSRAGTSTTRRMDASPVPLNIAARIAVLREPFRAEVGKADGSPLVYGERGDGATGAMLHARIRTLIYGCLDPKAGAVESRYRLAPDGWNHRLAVRGGVLAEECAGTLQAFFARRR